MRNPRGIKEALKHSHSNETYNLKGKPKPSGYDALTREELLEKIEVLEYDIAVLNDSLAANQRNYENVSRLLKAEKEKERKEVVSQKGEKEKFEGELRVAQARIKARAE